MSHFYKKGQMSVQSSKLKKESDFIFFYIFTNNT